MARSTVRRLAPIVLLAFLLTSCAGTMETIQNNPKAMLGGAAGAAGGGLIAAAAGGGTAGIIGGVLLGGLLGGAIGNALDQRDKQMAAEAAQRAFENNRSGAATTWQNPDSGHSGSITPTRTYQGGGGEYCREYQQTVVIGGEKQNSYGTACRRPDGTWEVQ
jgi:surface antigen